MMKRYIAVIISIFILVSALPLWGCAKDDGKTTVICTVFPIYDWVRNIVGKSDGVEVVLLVSGGADLHSYQPTADDIIAIRDAEMIVRGGGADDSFLNDILPDCEGIVDLSLMSAQGMTLRESVKESHGHSEGDGHAHAVDGHFWLSPDNAIASVEAICQSLCSLDEANAELYRKNADAYKEKLVALDGEYESAVSRATVKKVIFPDRFPFIYMTEEYGIEHSSAFEGCSTESDASFETVTRLASRLDEWGLSYVCVTESSDRELARAVINASKGKNAQILVFDSMQSVSASDISAGKNYIDIMKGNLNTLRIALGVVAD